MLVQELMTSNPVTVTIGAAPKEALTSLARLGITALPVVDERGHLHGLVSEADLIRDAVVHDPRAQERPIEISPISQPHTVGEVCTRQVLTLHPRDDVARAAEVMTSTSIKSMPVVDDNGLLVGMLSRSDIVQVLARRDDDIAADLLERLESLGHHGWVVTVEGGVAQVRGTSGLADLSLAHTVAHLVPGVVEVHVS